MELPLALLALILAAIALALAAFSLVSGRSAAARYEGLLEEIKQLAGAQRRVIEQLHSLDQRQRALSEKLNGIEQNAAGNGEPHEEGDEADRLDPQAVKEDILFLAKQGLNAETIARDLGVPRGEVELILDLERFGRNG